MTDTTSGDIASETTADQGTADQGTSGGPTVAERYRRSADVFVARVAAVDPAAWERPSPCEGWTARDVVQHVVDSHQMILGMAGEGLGDVPSAADDPLAAAEHTRAATLELLEDPARAGKAYSGMFGETTLEATLRDFICMDLVVHGWDVARATGGDERIAPADVEFVERQVRGLGDNLRRPGVCGPEVEVPADADPQAKLLGFLGRRP